MDTITTAIMAAGPARGAGRRGARWTRRGRRVLAIGTLGLGLVAGSLHSAATPAHAGMSSGSGPTPTGASGAAVFQYTGGAQYWDVPAGVYQVYIDAYGANGGNAGANGGVGAEIPILASVTPGERLTIDVGGRGGDGQSPQISWGNAGSCPGGAGGWNGGATGGACDYGLSGAGGGGQTDVMEGSTPLVIAAGGGGAGGSNATLAGGAGGNAGTDGSDGAGNGAGAGGNMASMAGAPLVCPDRVDGYSAGYLQGAGGGGAGGGIVITSGGTLFCGTGGFFGTLDWSAGGGGSGGASTPSVSAIPGMGEPSPDGNGKVVIEPFVDDLSPSISYSGASWSIISRSGLYQNSEHAASAVGAAAQYSFTGTGIAWIGDRGPADNASADVYVDGVLRSTVSAYNATAASGQVLYSVRGLPAGSHTIKIVVASAAQGSSLTIDGFRIFMEGTTINDTDGGISYFGDGEDGATGAWSYFANRGLGDYGNDVHATPITGDGFSYTFTGTGISYLGERNTDEGTAEVYLDGVDQGSINGYGATRTAQQVLWGVSGLVAGQHTLKVVSTGGGWLLLDALTVQINGATDNDEGTGSGTVYMDNSPAPAADYFGNGVTHYYLGNGSDGTNGTWYHSTGRGKGDYQDDVHATSTKGDSVSITFTGTGVSYITEKSADEGNVDVYLDGVYQQTVNCWASTYNVPQQVAYTIDGLAPGQHTLKIVDDTNNWMLLDAVTYWTD